MKLSWLSELLLICMLLGVASLAVMDPARCGMNIT
jgi:hypothetical protein